MKSLLMENQTILILNTFYIILCIVKTNGRLSIERCLSLVDCEKKKGVDLAEVICSTLAKNSILLNRSRGQGYDNGCNITWSAST